jgi:DNA helicase MCM8
LLHVTHCTASHYHHYEQQQHYAAAAAGDSPDSNNSNSEDSDQMTLTQRLRAAARHCSSDPIPQALLRKYIAYARSYCKPRLTVEAARVLQTLYLVMRSEAAGGRSMPITTRQLESLVRLSQARAKADLREEVTAQDAKDVVDMMQVQVNQTVILKCYMSCVALLQCQAAHHSSYC